MSTVLKLTTAEYDEMVAKGAFDGLQKRIELINGVIVEMNPAGPVHDDLIEFLNQWSVRNTDPEEVRVRIQSGLSLPELDSRPEPDVLWVKGRRYRDRHPVGGDVLLLIEVADSSLKSDRDTKAALYAKAGIIEYWIANVADEVIHVYREPAEYGYKMQFTVGSDNDLTPLAQPAAVLRPAELFADE
ncbi:MAG: Uma2 family endonuclease [Planctomycetota bacterium]|nr:Uma2 family endonuclease [Planctomycetota bacterium]